MDEGTTAPVLWCVTCDDPVATTRTMADRIEVLFRFGARRCCCGVSGPASRAHVIREPFVATQVPVQPHTMVR